MAEFKREDRYVVLKRKDLERLPVLLQETLWGFLEQAEFSLPKRQYVVVESDWPEYETVFKMIESRVNGKAVAASVPLTDLQICALRHNSRCEPWQPRKSDISFARAIESFHGISQEG